MIAPVQGVILFVALKTALSGITGETAGVGHSNKGGGERRRRRKLQVSKKCLPRSCSCGSLLGVETLRAETFHNKPFPGKTVVHVYIPNNRRQRKLINLDCPCMLRACMYCEAALQIYVVCLFLDGAGKRQTKYNIVLCHDSTLYSFSESFC